jgi:glycosyltransferase involved in cell wall biosynthesis
VVSGEAAGLSAAVGMNRSIKGYGKGFIVMAEKILSISIAAYNVASTLRECLDPFLRSKVLEQLDIMIVDDGSKDETAKIAQEYVRQCPGTFRLISKANGGWGSTVNAGIENARGRYFRQLDGDDYYEPENMAPYLTLLQGSEAEMVIAPYLEYDGETGKTMKEENCNPGCETGKVYPLADIPSFSPFMHSIAVKTECLRGRVAITEHCFYTDTEFVLKSCNQVHTVEFFDKPIYCYRRATVGQSMSLAGMEKHYQDQTTVIRCLLSYLKEEVKRPEVRKIYDSLLQGTCCWQYLVLLYLHPTRQHKKDLMAYDVMLKELAPDYYRQVTIGYLVRLRKLHFFGYTYYAKKQKAVDHRFSEDGRLLY